MRALLPIYIVMLAWTVSAQTPITAGRALKPLANSISTPSKAMDPYKTNKAPAKAVAPAKTAQPSRAPQAVPGRPAQATTAGDKPSIADGLAISTAKVVKGAGGIKCAVLITNNNAEPFVPYAQFAILDKDGAQVATLGQSGSELPAKGSGKIEVSTRAPSAADVKLIKVGGRTVSP